MFSKKEIQIILILSVIVLFVSGVSFAAYSHFSKAEPIATDDFSDSQAVLAESGEDYGYVVEDAQGDKIEEPSSYQVFEKEYSLGDEVLEGFVEEVTLQNYKIVKGDSIYSMARRFNIDEDVLKYNNPDLDKNLKIGAEVKIFSGNYIQYKVVKGDTVLAIANKFDVKVTDIIRINSLSTSEIKPGMLLILKNPDLESYNDKIAQDKISSGKLANLPKAGIGKGTSRTSSKTKGGFTIKWPIRWVGVTSGYGRRFHPVLKRYIFHQGVDLGNHYDSTYAAADGVVSTAGTMSGYGRIVVIKHSNGYETRYAHMNKISVRVGQRVKAGEYIGESGASGRVTGPHLHFEVRKNGTPLNPMLYR